MSNPFLTDVINYPTKTASGRQSLRRLSLRGQFTIVGNRGLRSEGQLAVAYVESRVDWGRLIFTFLFDPSIVYDASHI